MYLCLHIMNDNITNISSEYDRIRTLSALEEEIISCRRCDRLVKFREDVAQRKRRSYRDWNYWGKPVPGYGSANGKLLILGLAPAAHGGNRTGRVFTGDRSADFLFRCLHHVGLANQPNSDHREDGLILTSYITAAVKCVPPGDKPTMEERRNCANFLSKEFDLLNNLKIVLGLGKIGFDACLHHVRRSYELKMKDFPFKHGVGYDLPNGIRLYGAYHPSPRNVNTGRISFEMMVKFLQQLKKEI